MKQTVVKSCRIAGRGLCTLLSQLCTGFVLVALLLLLFFSTRQPGNLLAALIEKGIAWQLQATVNSAGAYVRWDSAAQKLTVDWQQPSIHLHNQQGFFNAQRLQVQLRYFWQEGPHLAVDDVLLYQPAARMIVTAQDNPTPLPMQVERLLAQLATPFAFPTNRVLIVDGVVQVDGDDAMPIARFSNMQASGNKTRKGMLTLATFSVQVNDIVMPLQARIDVRMPQEKRHISSILAHVAMQPQETTTMQVAEAVTINNAFATLEINPQEQWLHLRDAGVNIGASTLRLEASTRNTPAGMQLKMLASGQHLSFAQGMALWPPGLAPHPRHWLQENVVAGDVPSLSVSANLLLQQQTGVLTLQDLSGSMTMENFTVGYLPGAYKVMDAKAHATFSSDAIVIIADSATLNALPIGHATLTFADLSAKHQTLHIIGDIQGDLLKQWQIAEAITPAIAKYGLKSSSLKGTAATQLDITIPLLKHIATEDLKFSINSKAEQAAFQVPHTDIMVSQATIAASITPALVQVDGTGTIADMPGTWQWQAFIDGKNPLIEKVTARVQATPETLAEHTGINDLSDYAVGRVPLELMYEKRRDNKRENIQLSADLTAADLKIPLLSWHKPAAQPANFTAMMHGQNGNFSVLEDATFNSGKDSIKATASRYTQDNKNNFNVVVSTFNLADTALTAKVQKTNAAAYITADVEQLRLKKLPNNSGEEGFFKRWSRTQPVSVTASIKELQIAGAKPLRNVRHRGRFTNGAATLMHLRADVEGQPCSVLMDPRPENTTPDKTTLDKATLDFKAVCTGKGGEFLNALNIYPNMMGGDLNITGTVNQKDVFNGNLHLKDFRLLKAPILAKILTIGSVIGPLQLLTGKGMPFGDLRVDLSQDGDNVTVHKLKMTGNSIGLQGVGSIDTAENQIDFKGAVIPAYMLTRAVENIPLIGGLLTNDSKEGLIAMRFQVSGSMDDPDVSVNPLTALTPGFLRGLFDIF